MPDNNHHAIVTCAQSETEYITEWLVYHRLIGIDHVYIYCNDDEPRACWEKLLPFLGGREPFVTFMHSPSAVFDIYQHFLGYKVHEVDWFIFLDVDEFLVFREDGTIGNFLAKREHEAEMIFINSLVFGISDFQEQPVGGVLRNRTWRSRYLSPITKVLTRSRTLNRGRYLTQGQPGFWYNWNFRGEKLTRAVNVIGEDMSDYFGRDKAGMCAFLQDGDRPKRIIATAIIHRYLFRSEGDVQRRLKCGKLEEFEGQFLGCQVIETGSAAAFIRQFSEVEDKSLHDYWQAVCGSIKTVLTPDC